MSRRTIEITRTIRELTIEHVQLIDGKKYPAMMITLRRFEDLCRADDSCTSEIDGYPKKTPMAAPPSAQGVRYDHDGNLIADNPDDAGDDYPTEIAALARIAHPDTKDAVHRVRMSAQRSVEIIARELPMLLSALERADNLRSLTPPLTEYCWVAKSYGLPFDQVWEIFRKTTFKKALKPAWPEERGVSRWVYDFTRQQHRLPTESEMRQRLEREAVLIPVGASA